METHVKVLAVVYLVFSALGLLAAFFVATVMGVAGVAAAGAGGSTATVALPIIGLTGTALCIFLLVVSLPGLVAGVGLLNFKPWARILTLVLSVLHLFNFPFGTVVGSYGLYVLLSEEGARLFKVLPPAAA